MSQKALIIDDSIDFYAQFKLQNTQIKQLIDTVNAIQKQLLADKIYTIKEIVQMSPGVSARAVQNWVDKGYIKTLPRDFGDKILIPALEWQRFIQEKSR